MSALHSGLLRAALPRTVMTRRTHVQAWLEDLASAPYVLPSRQVTLGTEDGIKLQGGLYRAPLLHRQGSTLHEGADALIFLLSPHLYNIDDLESRNL